MVTGDIATPFSLTLIIFFICFARYNGRQGEVTKQFPPSMEEACRIVELIVNDEMRKRKRFPLEWGGDPGDPEGHLTWRANFAAANCYEGAKEAVGFHSDRLTSIGPYPTIASLSLGAQKPACTAFRLTMRWSWQELVGCFAFGKSFPLTRLERELLKHSTSLYHITRSVSTPFARPGLYHSPARPPYSFA